MASVIDLARGPYHVYYDILARMQEAEADGDVEPQVSVYVYMNVHIYIYIYVYVYMYMYVYVYIYLSEYIGAYKLIVMSNPRCV